MVGGNATYLGVWRGSCAFSMECLSEMREDGPGAKGANEVSGSQQIEATMWRQKKPEKEE